MNSIIGIEEFATVMADSVASALDEQDVDISINTVMKNNGVKRHGLTIRKHDSNVAPTVYVDDAYKDYCDGDSLEDCAARLIEVYKSTDEPKFEMDFFEDFEEVSTLLFPKLINFERNREMLMDCPHIKFGNLAVIFQVVLCNDGDSIGAITVKHEHAANWGKTAKEMYDIAIRNAKDKNPTRIRGMFDVLSELIMFNATDNEVLSPETIAQLQNDDKNCMYVMSSGKTNGAVALLDIDALRSFAEKKNANLLILPSSIHELIVLTEKENPDIKSLQEMVKEVNDTQVPPEDILSGDVYRYDLQTGLLTIAETSVEMRLAS